MVVKSLDVIDIEPYIKGYETGRFCMKNGIDFYVLSSSPDYDSNIEISDLKVCAVDETTLKTMVRSDPGYLLLKEGTIVHKWSWANLPDKEELIKITRN